MRPTPHIEQWPLYLFPSSSRTPNTEGRGRDPGTPRSSETVHPAEAKVFDSILKGLFIKCINIVSLCMRKKKWRNLDVINVHSS